MGRQWYHPAPIARRRTIATGRLVRQLKRTKDNAPQFCNNRQNPQQYRLPLNGCRDFNHVTNDVEMRIHVVVENNNTQSATTHTPLVKTHKAILQHKIKTFAICNACVVRPLNQTKRPETLPEY